MFLEFFVVTLGIFLLWVIQGASTQIKGINWVALLVTAIILGVVMVVEYFMQKFEQMTIRAILKGRSTSSQ